MPNQNYRRGVGKENLYARTLEANGWVCAVTRGSHGPYDVMAVKAGERPRLVQVKATKARFAGFPPDERAELIALGLLADADVLLVHYPPRRRGAPDEIPPAAWPGAKGAH